MEFKGTDNDIINYIQTECRHPDGTPMMDEQHFYEGAKWFRSKQKVHEMFLFIEKISKGFHDHEKHKIIFKAKKLIEEVTTI